jgi:hypothetical protein
MSWHVQYIRDNVDQIEMHSTPEAAIEAACRLMDDGYEVFGIGAGPLSDMIDREQIARIYQLWAREKRTFGIRRRS